MAQPPPDQPQNWETLGIWAGVLVSVLLACGSAIRIFFGLVSRREMQEQLKEERVEWAKQLAAQRDEFSRHIEAQRVTFYEHIQRQYAENQRQDAEKVRMHEDNRDTARQTFERVAIVEQAVARIEGTLSGRFPGIQR